MASLQYAYTKKKLDLYILNSNKNLPEILIWYSLFFWWWNWFELFWGKVYKKKNHFNNINITLSSNR